MDRNNYLQSYQLKNMENYVFVLYKSFLLYESFLVFCLVSMKRDCFDLSLGLIEILDIILDSPDHISVSVDSVSNRECRWSRIEHFFTNIFLLRTNE